MSTHYVGTETETLILDTWIKLNRANNSIGHVLRHNMDGHGITMTQFGVLEILEHLGSLPLKTIGEKILLSSSNLVTVIDNLEKQGLVNRQNNPADRRSVMVCLTDKGKSTLKPIFQSHLEQLVECFSILNEDELKVLGELSKKLGLNQSSKAKE
ncbi:MAG: MarR family transcriptional regulator [Candidatus Marinimicrobia bacterium]|nr:MarR family transcriptional regulator [Candidatus Neomarinimicrobiota bacterium]